MSSFMLTSAESSLSRLLSRPADADNCWQEDIIPPVLSESVQNGDGLEGNMDGDETETEDRPMSPSSQSDHDGGIAIKSEPQVIVNELVDEDMPDYPESPSPIPYDDDPKADPDYSQDEEELAAIECYSPIICWPKIELPEDANFDAIIELDRVEETFDEKGKEVRAWRCKLCSIRFQFHASYAKHNEREHPEGLPQNWWDQEEEDPVRELDRCFQILDDSDDDFDPKYRRHRRSRRPVGRPPKRGGKRPGTRLNTKLPLKVKLVPKEKPEPAVCCECNKEFPSKKQMKTHQKRHHFLPFECKVCEKRFDTFKKYYVHSEMMHDTIVVLEEDKQQSLSDAGESEAEDCRQPVEEIKSSLFPCTLCSRHYVTDIALSGHMLRSHGDEIPDLAVIETHKRVWKTRFDPENIAKHESALEKLGEAGKETAKVKKIDDTYRSKKKKPFLAIRDVPLSSTPEDLGNMRQGPIVLSRSKKTLEELIETQYQRRLRQKRKLMEAQGVDPESVTITPRGTRKTVAQKLATHMAKLERRRVRERAKREEQKANGGGEKESLEDLMNADTEPECELDPETGEQISKGSKKKKKKKKRKSGDEGDNYPNKYGGVKDFCRLCNKEFENDRLTVLHLKEEHSKYTAEDKKREAEILKDMLPPEEVDEKKEPVPGQGGSRYKKPFLCDICKKSFIAAYKLAAHREDEHQQKLIIDDKEVSRECPEELKRTEDQRIICQHCGKDIRKRSIRLHMLRVHAGEPFRKSFPCDMCDKSYPVAHHLFWHRRKAHMGTVLFTCELCGKEISSPRTFKIHMRVHNGYMFSCKHCGEKFKSQQGVANHEKRHTETMNFECKFCAKRFWWPRDVNKHERTVHEDGVVHHDQIAINRAKDWEAESAVNAKKMRYLTDNPRAPNGARKRGRPRKKKSSSFPEEEEESVSQEFVPPSGHMTRSAAAAAKEAIVKKPTRKSKAQKKRDEEHEQMRAIESLDLDGLEEHGDFSVVQDHLTTACQQILTIPSHQQPVNLNPHHSHHHQHAGSSSSNHHAGHGGSYSVLHNMQTSHTMSHHQQAAVSQMFLNSCMQQQQMQYQVPLIPGDCKLCRVRTNDLRSHYSEVHKVLPDVVQHFL